MPHRPRAVPTSSARRDAALGERTARPRDRVVVRRDRDRDRRWRIGAIWPTSSPPRSRCTRHREASSRRSPPERTFAGSSPCSTKRGPTRASRGTTSDSVAVTYWTRACRLAPRRHQLRQGPGMGPRPAAGGCQPPRGPRLRGVAAGPRRSRGAGAGLSAGRDRSSPGVTRSLPRCETTLRIDCLAPPWTMRRRGLRQGRPAPRPRLPGRSRDRPRGRGGDGARPGVPAGLAGRLVRIWLLGLKTAARRIIDEARRDAVLTGAPDEVIARASDAELAWGFQDAVVDVLVHEAVRARALCDRRPVDRPWVAVSPPTVPSANGSPARPTPSASR